MNKIYLIVLFLLHAIISVSCWTLYSLCLVGMNLNYSWLKYSSSINTVKSVFNEISVISNMRKFLSCLLNIWKVFSPFILKFTNFLTISYFSCLGFFLPFLLFLLFLLNLFLNFSLFFFNLFCQFFRTVDFMKQLTSSFSLT